MCEKYELSYMKHTRYNKNKKTKRYLKLVCGHSFPSLSQKSHWNPYAGLCDTMFTVSSTLI